MTKQKFKFDPAKRDDPDGPTNDQRAERAAEAVVYACGARGEHPDIGEDGIRDLLADLGHLCDREGYDYKSLLDLAWDDWRAER